MLEWLCSELSTFFLLPWEFRSLLRSPDLIFIDLDLRDSTKGQSVLYCEYTLPYVFVLFRYSVADVQCTFSTVGSDIEDLITATLKRPAGFKGSPMFADDRIGVKEPNPNCIISRDTSDEDDRTYNLRINDFTRCGVLKRNVSTVERCYVILLLIYLCHFVTKGFVHVRIWFPQFPGVVMQSDQELIIMCKPPEPTIIENKAAGFAGSL